MVTATAVTVPVAPVSIWADIKATLRSIFGAVVATARTTEKAVNLVENEVDNLNEMQEIRLDMTKAERAQQKVQINAMLNKRPARKRKV